MRSSAVAWMAIGTATFCTTLQNAFAAEAWNVSHQPDLKQALEQAPLLQTESLGEPARGVNVWERWFVPNHDGKTWDLLQIYFKEYYGPTWLHAVDLGTGVVEKQRLADGHQFYLSGRTLGFDGKFYIATPSRRTWSMGLFVYDPATNTLEDRGEIVPGLGGETRPLATGPDRRIYGTGTRGSQVGLYIYDPELRKVVKDFGAVGPKHPNGAWSRYVMGVDDTHAYIASGMVPAWYLVAVNLKTGEQKVLLKSPSERVMDILERFPGCYARVPQGGGAPDKEYWLYHGEVIPMTNSTPPWPKQTSPWDKAVPKPEVYFGQMDPNEKGNAVLWHRSQEAAKAEKTRPPQSADAKPLPEQMGWKSIRLKEVEAYPHRLNPLSVLPDGRLYGTGDDYVGTFLFDPKTDVTEQKIVREIIPVAKARATGLIIEAAPGRLLGLTVEGAKYGKPGAGILYGMDLATGDVLFRKPLPWPVSVDDHWPHWVDPSYEYLSLARGPDGFIWTYLKDVLVRIAPQDARIHVVGKIDPVGHPTFVGKDLYFSGPEQLRRIRSIAR